MYYCCGGRIQKLLCHNTNAEVGEEGLLRSELNVVWSLKGSGHWCVDNDAVLRNRIDEQVRRAVDHSFSELAVNQVVFTATCTATTTTGYCLDIITYYNENEWFAFDDFD